MEKKAKVAASIVQIEDKQIGQAMLAKMSCVPLFISPPYQSCTFTQERRLADNRSNFISLLRSAVHTLKDDVGECSIRWNAVERLFGQSQTLPNAVCLRSS